VPKTASTALIPQGALSDWNQVPSFMRAELGNLFVGQQGGSARVARQVRGAWQSSIKAESKPALRLLEIRYYFAVQVQSPSEE
jgi:predicted component of type VI protein secretion system